MSWHVIEHCMTSGQVVKWSLRPGVMLNMNELQFSIFWVKTYEANRKNTHSFSGAQRQISLRIGTQLFSSSIFAIRTTKEQKLKLK